MEKKVVDAIKAHRAAKGLDAFGQPLLDSVPLAPPVGYRRQPSIAEQVRQAVQAERRRELEQVTESLEQADDFEIPDDPADPGSRWENDREPSIKELIAAGRKRLAELEAEDAKKKAAGGAGAGDSPAPAGRPGAHAEGVGDQGGSGGPPPEKKPL